MAAYIKGMYFTILLLNLVTEFISTLPPSGSTLDLWVDNRQIKNIISYMGMMDYRPGTKKIFRIRCNPRRGSRYDTSKMHLPPRFFFIDQGIQMKNHYNKAYTIPPQVERITLAWRSTIKAQYDFKTLSSRDRTVMHNPLLDVPRSGNVPTTDAFFTITLPCTKKRTSTVNFHIEVEFILNNNQRLNISQMVRKYCLSSADTGKQKVRCFCRHKCSSRKFSGRRSCARKKLDKVACRKARTKQRRNCYRRCRRRCKSSGTRRNLCIRRADNAARRRRRRRRRLRQRYSKHFQRRRRRRWLHRRRESRRKNKGRRQN